jgi:polyisoprenoid-binding protein YceI
MNENGTLTVRYELNSAQSEFTVQAFAAGLFSGFGHNPTVGIREFTGEAQFSPDALYDGSLRLVINAKSLEVLDDVKEKDKQEIERVMHTEVLETARFPEIIFQSTSTTLTKINDVRYKAKIIGDLTMHGTTRNGLWIMPQMNLNGDELTATGNFTIKQTDYGIKLVSIAAGALKLKDELKFTFNLVGNKSELL